MMLKPLLAGALLLCSLGSVQAQPAAPPAAQSVDDLLKMVEEGISRDQAEQRARLAEFEKDQSLQEQRLAQARAELKNLETQSAAMEQRFSANDARIVEEEARLNERLGSLKELFGVLGQVTGEFKGAIATSPISAQVPGRDHFLTALLTKAGSSSEFPSIAEIEKLWFEMQREFTQSGKVVKFTAPVIDPTGKPVEREVTRVGTFNVLADGRYVVVDTSTGQLVELSRQPAGRYLSAAEDFESAAPGSVEAFWLDPSRGSILSLIIQSPSFTERVHQGGLVGYVIIALGAFAVLLAAERMFTLSRIGARVNAQMRSKSIAEDNPLGRVMQTYRKFEQADRETLELKLTESIAQEAPPLQRYLPMLKIISVVAPLLGLLGTVTGMIQTFQAITLFGTGDPKLMAGGISQALVTTVQGLVVAIPAVLLYTLVNGRSRRIAQIIEERAVGLMAEHSERGHAHVGTA